jgi:hypothetical protein
MLGGIRRQVVPSPGDVFCITKGGCLGEQLYYKPDIHLCCTARQPRGACVPTCVCVAKINGLMYFCRELGRELGMLVHSHKRYISGP